MICLRSCFRNIWQLSASYRGN